MHPTEKLEQMSLERLHAETDAIHPTGAVAGEVCTFHGSGIGLQRNLAVRLDIEQRGCAFENAADARRLKGRRSSTAEEDCLDASAAPMIHGGIVIQLLNQCCCVICFRDFRNDVGIKIAVRTFADAIGNMNVEGKGLFVSRHDNPIILTKDGGYNTCRKLAWLKLQYVTIPQDPEAVALQPAQFSDHLLAELRFKVSN